MNNEKEISKRIVNHRMEIDRASGDDGIDSRIVKGGATGHFCFFFFSFPGMKRRFLRPGVFHRPDCDTRAELISASGCVRVRHLYGENLRPMPTRGGSKPSAPLSADNFVVCGERLNRVRELNGKEAELWPSEEERGEEAGEERAKKPIIRENTAGCHSQKPERDDWRTRFAGYIIPLSVVAPFKRRNCIAV